MRQRVLVVAAAWAALAAGSVGLARAGVRVVWERNQGDAATAEFKFKSVPSPSATDAANGAKLSILDGRPDVNGLGVAVLRDGRLPANLDDPGENFSFAAGTPGGRLMIDLGKATKVARVNTYSWHATTRGPQVYKLYDGGLPELRHRGPRQGHRPQVQRRYARGQVRPGAVEDVHRQDGGRAVGRVRQGARRGRQEQGWLSGTGPAGFSCRENGALSARAYPSSL